MLLPRDLQVRFGELSADGSGWIASLGGAALFTEDFGEKWTRSW